MRKITKNKNLGIASSHVPDVNKVQNKIWTFLYKLRLVMEEIAYNKLFRDKILDICWTNG